MKNGRTEEFEQQNWGLAEEQAKEIVREACLDIANDWNDYYCCEYILIEYSTYAAEFNLKVEPSID